MQTAKFMFGITTFSLLPCYMYRLYFEVGFVSYAHSFLQGMTLKLMQANHAIVFPYQVMEVAQGILSLDREGTSFFEVPRD